MPADRDPMTKPPDITPSDWDAGRAYVEQLLSEALLT